MTSALTHTHGFLASKNTPQSSFLASWDWREGREYLPKLSFLSEPVWITDDSLAELRHTHNKRPEWERDGKKREHYSYQVKMWKCVKALKPA